MSARFGSGGRRRAQQRHRKLRIEDLERRLVLSYAPADISTSQQQIIETGLDELVTWAAALDGYEAVAQALPVAGYSIGHSLDLDQVLDQGLVQPVHDYFDSVPEGNLPTSQGLVDTLQNLSDQAGIQITVAAGSAEGGLTDPDADYLLFELDLEAVRTYSVAVSLGPRGDEMGLAFGPASAPNAVLVDLATTLVLNFAFGVDLTPDLPAEEAFLIRVDDFELSAEVLTSSPTGDMVVGFYDARVTSSTLSLDAALDVTLTNPDSDPDGNLTLEELSNAALDALVTLTPAGTNSASATMSVAADPFGGFTPGGGLSVSFSTSDPFDPPALTFSSDFAELLDFTNVSSYSVLGVLNQLGSFLHNLRGESVFDTAVQLAGSTRLGDVVDLGGVIKDPAAGLIKKLTSDPPEGSEDAPQPKFDSVQSLAAELMTALGLSSNELDAAYDENTRELTFHLVIDQSFMDQNLPFGVDLDLSPLGSLDTSAEVVVAAGASLDSVFGIDLSKPVAVLKADAAGPADGKLSAGSAFWLQIGGQDPVAVTVSASATDDNTELAHLVADLNAALTAAGLDDDVEAGLDGDRVTFSTKGPGVAASVRLLMTHPDDPDHPGDPNDPILTQVHFVDRRYATDSVTQHTFFESASIRGAAGVTATDIGASAEFGFLGVEVAGGSGTASVAVDLELKNPTSGVAGGRVYLPELFRGLAQDISTVVAGPTVSGSAAATLPFQVTPNILGSGHPANPRLVLAWPDVTDADTLSVEFVDAGLLEDFTHLDTSTVLSTFAALASYLADLEGYSWLDQNIPGIERSVAEVIDYAAQFLEFVAALKEDPGSVLQDVEARIEQAFGLNESLVDLSLVEDNTVIRIDVTLEASVGRQLPFQLDLARLDHEDLGTLFDVSASGQLDATARAVFNLDCGIDISDPLNPRPFLYETSQLSMGVTVAGNDIQFTTALGPLGIWVKQGRLLIDGDGDPDTGADLVAVSVLLNDGQAGDKIFLSDLDLDDAHLALTGQVSAHLPVYFPTEHAHLGNIDLVIADVGDIENSTTLLMPDFESLFGDFDLLNNLGGVLNGVDYVLTALQDVLSSKVFSTSWPLIGDGLQDAADFIGDIRTDVIQKLRDRFGENFDHTSTMVQQALYEALGPAGLEWLKDRGVDGVTMEDIMTTAFDLDADGEADDQLEWSMWLGQEYTLADVPVDFDIGIPALGLDVDANVRLELGFVWKLAFGINRTDGPYLVTDNPEDPGDEFLVYIRATTPGLEARGNLLFFQLDVRDHILDDHLGSRFMADVSVDLKDPNEDGKLTMSELWNFVTFQYPLEQVLEPGIAGSADVALDLTVSYEGDARFPSLSTTFKLGWGFSDETGLGGGVPTIQFQDVRLNLGQFISDFADSALKEVRKVTEPLQPIFDFLTEPLPVISDFGLEYTPLDLVELFGYGDVATFIEALDGVVSLINDVPVLSDDLYIPLGSFELNGEDVVSAEDLSEVDPVPVGAPVDVRQEIRNNADVDAFYSQTEEVEISFPILEQPLNAFRLLLGQDVDLFLLDLPKLQVGFGIPIFKIGPLGPYPIFISLAGYLGVEADLKFGYDTYGLRTYLETNDPLDVFSGFFISDRENADGTGKDVPEGTLTGGLDVGVEVGVVVAAAGVSGGISLSLFADLDDPDNDGKVHLDEFLGNLNIGLLSTFDVSGEINFVLKAYFELLFSRIEVTILEVTLASFELEDEDIYVDRFAGGGGGGGGGGLPPGGSGELPPADQIRLLGIAPGLHVDGLGLDSSSDVDWYEFELLRSDSITVDVRHNCVHGDLNLDVYDAYGTLLGSSYTDHDREIVSLDALPDGKYYVRVSGQRNNYMVAVEPNEHSTTRVIYVNPAGKVDRSDSYYTTAPGDDRWDGLLYRKPKATLESVLAGYDLGPHDLIVLDSGQHAAGAVIAAEDEGATIIGSVAGSYLSGVVLRDSDHTLFEMVGFRGSGTGLHLEGDGAGDAQGNVVRRCVFDAIDVGIRIDSRESNLIENNRFVAPEEGSAGTGIYLSPGVISTVRDNDIAGRRTGIYNDSRVADVYGNLIHQNAVGMSSRRGVLGPDNPAPYGTAGGLPVNIMDANGIGILIPSDAVGVVVRFNEIRSSGEVGIDQQGEGSRIIANHVHDNPIGIRGTHAIGPDGWGAELHNLVQANEVGVLAQNGSEVRYNRIYENGTGIQVESGTWIHHNLIYRNSGDGVLVEGARNVDIVNNTIYAPGGDGVRIRDFSEQVLVRDNIIYTQSGHGLYIEADSQFGYASDYNNLYATGGGRVAFQGKSFDDVYDWQVEAEMDLHSIGRTDPHPARDDPRFVNLAEDDFHLMSESTSIDAGHPGSDYSREPGPNGGRVNLGAYGNTPEAATSAASWLRITAPSFYVDLVPSRSYQIRWETYQVPGSDTLNIDLVEVGPETRWRVATAVQVSAGSVTWSPGDFVSGDTNKRYRIALSTSGATSLTAASREAFSIPAIVPAEAHTFYVNDESAADDEYTTAVGNNRNTGTTAADPKVVIRPLVLSYNLDTGDEVRVDTGGYVHAVNLNLSGSPMTFDPRMNTVRDTLISGPTDLNRLASVDRANEYRGSKAFDIIASDEMELRHLTILGAWTGVHVRQDSDNLVGEHLTLFDHSEDGMTIEGHSDGAVLDWLTVHDNGRDGVFADSLLVRITHSKVYDNGRIGLALRSVGGCLVETSEVYGNRTGIDIINPGTARAVVGHGDLSAGLGNRVYENDGDGIFASGNVLVAGNTVAKNGSIGIHLDDGADAERNVVRQHVTGISALGSESNVIENRSYENTDTGIEASYASYLHRNVTYSNGNKGIYVDRYSGVMDHNLVYDTGWASIHVAGPGTAPELINNTVYEPCPYNEFEPPPDKTTIEIPWRWHVEMEGWEGWHVLTFEGTARIEFQPPAGQIPGETFDLGRGGGADAKTPEPVPPDQEWTIATEIVELNLQSTTSVYGGPMLATLDPRAASTGLITVSNVDGQLVGEAQFEMFVQFELPDGETRLVSGEILPKPVQTLTLFGEGGELGPYDVLQAAIPLVPSGFEWITLFAQLGEQPPLPPPWGSWIFGGGFLGPPPQDAGRYCAEIGILVSDSSSYVLLRNNAVFVEGSNNAPGGVISRDVVVAADSTMGWQSDFNVLTTTYGAIGEWAGQLAPTLAHWQAVSRDDNFSLDPSPRTIWVDPDGLDDKLGFVAVGTSDGRDDNLHLRSPFGEVAQGALAPVEDLGGGGGGGGSIGLPIMEPVLWQSDASPLVQDLSPAVDMGDPQYAYLNEPAENGQMINIGAYGNTSQASLSEPHYIHVVYPLGLEQWVAGRTYDIQWRSRTPPPPASGSSDLTIELRHGSKDGLVELTLSTTVPDTGSFVWTVPSSGPGIGPVNASDYVIVITWPGDPLDASDDVVGTSRRQFTIDADGTPPGDTVPPAVLDVVPRIIRYEQRTNDATIAGWTLIFSENLDATAAADANSYQLDVGGYTLTPTYTAGNTDDDTSRVALQLSGSTVPLPAGDYELTVLSSAILDTGGVHLDGDADGTAGGDYVRRFTIDLTAPSVTIPAITPNPSSGGLDQLSIVFSEAVRGFGLADLRLTRDSGSNVLTGEQTLTSSDGINWTLGNLSEVTAEAGSYSLQLIAADSGIVDEAGNPLSSGASTQWSTDTTPPTVAVTPVAPDPRSTGVDHVCFTFSEAISGFDWSDLVLRRDGGSNLLTDANTVASSDGINWTVGGLSALTASPGTYTLSLAAAGSGIVDHVGNALSNDAFEIWEVDTTGPTAWIVGVTPDPRNGPVNEIAIVFDEAVTGLDLADLSLTRNGGPNLLSGAETLLTSDQITWRLGGLQSLTGAEGDYQLTLTAAGSGILNGVSLPLTSDAGDGWRVDLVPPTGAIAPLGPDPHREPVGVLTIVFSEAVVGFSLDQITLSRSGGANLLTGGEMLTTGDSVTWTLAGLSALTAPSGTYTLTVPAAGTRVNDAAGNALAGDVTVTWVQDAGAPTVDLVDVTPDPRSTAVEEIQIVFSEPVEFFGIENLFLYLDGEPLALAGVATLHSSDDMHWQLGNLSTLTAAQGTYGLALRAFGSQIQDRAGNVLRGGTTESWVMEADGLTWLLDFDAGSGLTAAGYVGVPLTKRYAAGSGSSFGWDPAAAPLASFDRYGPDDLLRDGHYGYDGTFLLDVADAGLYVVNVVIGDTAPFYHDLIEVSVEGTPQRMVSTTAGQWTSSSLVVAAGGDQTLSLRLRNAGGVDPHYVINALRVRARALVKTITVTPPSPGAALDADGTTVDTYWASGATPGSLVTVASTLGTITSPDQSTTYQGVQVLADGSGNFSFTIRRPSGVATSPTVAAITAQEVEGTGLGEGTQQFQSIQDPGTVLRFDFNASLSMNQPGFTPVGPRDLYSGTRGYGWSTRVAAADRPESGMSLLNRDLHTGSNATFRVNAEPGKKYYVRVYLANPLGTSNYRYTYDNFDVIAEDQTFHVDQLIPDTVTTHVFEVTIGAGDTVLDVRFVDRGGQNFNWVVSGMDIWTTTDPGQAALLAASAATGVVAGAALSEAALAPVVAEAAARWSAAGLTAAQTAALAQVQFQVADLGGAYLGLANTAMGVVRIDDDAAGWGWSVISDRLSVIGHRSSEVGGQRSAISDRLPITDDRSPMTGVDLLDVVMHEIGHLLGYGHSEDPGDLMAPVWSASPLHSSSRIPDLATPIPHPSSPVDAVFGDRGREGGDESGAELLESRDTDRLAAAAVRSSDEAAQARDPRRSGLQRYERELDDWFAQLAAVEDTMATDE